MQQRQKEDYICVDKKFHEDSILIQTNQELFLHMSHKGLKSLNDIRLDMQENEGIVNEFMAQHDLNQQLGQLDEQMKILETNLKTKINIFIEQIKTQLREKFVETQRLKDLLHSIKSDDIIMLENLRGDFSFLLNIKNLPELSKSLELPNIKDRQFITRLQAIMNRVWDDLITQTNQNLQAVHMKIINQIDTKQYLNNVLAQQTMQDEQEQQRIDLFGINESIKNGTFEGECQGEENQDYYREYTYPNGVVYKGQMRHNYRHGLGELTSILGQKYIGNWQNDMRNGQGQEIQPSGMKYIGMWRDNCRHGHGQQSWPSGRQYIGMWQENMMHGQGQQIIQSGEEYNGMWCNNLRHGHGELVLLSGQRYIGMWQNDKRNGQGENQWTSGDKYIGMFKDDQRHGYGEHTKPSGKKYTGMWCENKMHGQGEEILTSGEKYIGSWKDDMKDGQGELIYASGIVKKGQWQNDRKQQCIIS